LTYSTIIALASGPGPSGVAIIRVSGKRAGDVLRQVAGSIPTPRSAVIRSIRDDKNEAIDKALILWFPAPASFTGEDVAELHVHGSKAVIAEVMDACLKVPSVELAKPGDFTRRAFENGKMDLSAAEGLADLVDAETKAQRQQALRQMEGGLAKEVAAWRDDLIDAIAHAEGDIDFPDEDLPTGLSQRVRDRIEALRQRLIINLAQSDRAMRVRDGFRVAIVGAPNAGKSSLLNALARRDAAIVSPIAGTTRDVVEIRLVLSGIVVWIADTAGLREATDDIEAQGVCRAIRHAKEADLRIGLFTSPQERAALSEIIGPNDIWALSKSDVQPPKLGISSDLRISSVTGIGLPTLEDTIVAQAMKDLSRSDGAPLTRLRHKIAVVEAIDALTRALNANGGEPELIAEDLRLATRSLGQIIGRVDMEEVLDRLFSQFCIGK
jgi:tRNA modification GTPase